MRIHNFLGPKLAELLEICWTLIRDGGVLGCKAFPDEWIFLARDFPNCLLLFYFILFGGQFVNGLHHSSLDIVVVLVCNILSIFLISVARFLHLGLKRHSWDIINFILLHLLQSIIVLLILQEPTGAIGRSCVHLFKKLNFIFNMRKENKRFLSDLIKIIP